MLSLLVKVDFRKIFCWVLEGVVITSVSMVFLILFFSFFVRAETGFQFVGFHLDQKDLMAMAFSTVMMFFLGAIVLAVVGFIYLLKSFFSHSSRS